MAKIVFLCRGTTINQTTIAVKSANPRAIKKAIHHLKYDKTIGLFKMSSFSNKMEYTNSRGPHE